MASLNVRPRLLFLCQTLPYPPDGGVWIRTYHILRLLARAFDITALCFERAAMPGNGPAGDTAASCAALSRFAAIEVFPVPQRRSRIRYVWDHVRFATQPLESPDDIVEMDQSPVVSGGSYRAEPRSVVVLFTELEA